MASAFLQYLFSGITLGAIYALAGLGFSIIYNASHVINFAQGEFLMIGGMATVALVGMGVPMELAIPLAVLVTALVGLALARFAVLPAKDASVVTVIIITIGASIFLRGLAQVVWDKEFHALPAFTGTAPLNVLGATMLPQSLWVLGVSLTQLVGVPIRRVLLTSFGLSAALGAIGGIVVAPITFTSYETGIMLGLKGFSAAVLGGLGNGLGAVLGGLIVGIAEAMSAGYLSSAYKDATAFVIILAVLFFLPNGLLGHKGSERV
jgi:branched-chain amino acid transport system permease protein